LEGVAGNAQGIASDSPACAFDFPFIIVNTDDAVAYFGQTRSGD